MLREIGLSELDFDIAGSRRTFLKSVLSRGVSISGLNRTNLLGGFMMINSLPNIGYIRMPI
jgi:hypothetical protein